MRQPRAFYGEEEAIQEYNAEDSVFYYLLRSSSNRNDILISGFSNVKCEGVPSYLALTNEKITLITHSEKAKVINIKLSLIRKISRPSDGQVCLEYEDQNVKYFYAQATKKRLIVETTASSKPSSEIYQDILFKFDRVPNRS